MSTDSAARQALVAARTIAVLGASDTSGRAGFYVPEYLYQQGYRVLPVNPQRVGDTLWGQPVRATLAELCERVDIVDVFRAPQHLSGHVDDVLAMTPHPSLVWLQLGAFHPGFQAAMADAGIPVIANRCTLADHRAFGLGPVASGRW